MQLKFYLNKFLKVDNIENYTLEALKKLEEIYDDFKEKTDGIDPDFPEVKFKTKGTKLTVGTNVYSLMDAKPDSAGAIRRVNTDSSGSKTRTEGKPSAGRLEKMPPNIHTNKRK